MLPYFHACLCLSTCPQSPTVQSVCPLFSLTLPPSLNPSLTPTLMSHQVEDVARAFEVILHRGTAGKIYNIGGTNEKANIEVAKDLIRLMGHERAEEKMLHFVADRAFNGTLFGWVVAVMLFFIPFLLPLVVCCSRDQRDVVILPLLRLFVICSLCSTLPVPSFHPPAPSFPQTCAIRSTVKRSSSWVGRSSSPGRTGSTRPWTGTSSTGSDTATLIVPWRRIPARRLRLSFLRRVRCEKGGKEGRGGETRWRKRRGKQILSQAPTKGGERKRRNGKEKENEIRRLNVAGRGRGNWAKREGSRLVARKWTVWIGMAER